MRAGLLRCARKDGGYIHPAIDAEDVDPYSIHMKRNSGFTLLEILIVVMVIGIASTLVVIQVSDSYLSSNRPDFFAKEMQSLIELARKQAIFNMQVIGLKITSNEYTFLQLNIEDKAGKWQSLGKKDSFWARREIPPKIVMTYHAETQTQKELNSSSAPKIIINPSGEVTPFTITIRGQGEDKSYEIKGTYGGSIKLTEKS